MPPTADWRPWNRFRPARQGDGTGQERALQGVTVDGFRSWAFRQGLTERQPEAGVVAGDGGHRLGSVRAYCLLEGEPATVVGLEVAVTASHPAAPPDLAAFLLQPVAPALAEAQRAALDTWLRGQLAHGGPHNAATTLGGVQVAIGIDDANPRGRTWSLTARPV